MLRRRPHPPAGPSTVVGLGVAAALLLAACSIGSDASSPPPPVTRDVSAIASTTTEVPDVTAVVDSSSTTIEPEPLDFAIEWEPVGDRVERGRLTVPLDYADPGGETIELEVARHLAPESSRVGSLLVNRGGPGAASSDMA